MKYPSFNLETIEDVEEIKNPKEVKSEKFHLIEETKIDENMSDLSISTSKIQIKDNSTYDILYQNQSNSIDGYSLFDKQKNNKSKESFKNK